MKSPSDYAADGRSEQESEVDEMELAVAGTPVDDVLPILGVRDAEGVYPTHALAL